MPAVPLSRRNLLAGAAALPLLGALGPVASRLRDAAPLLRPREPGGPARCAQCGARDHTMLSSACPAAPGRHMGLHGGGRG